MQSFVNGVPNGSTILFPPGGIYRVTNGIRLDGRQRLTFAGNGSTLQAAGCNVANSPFVLGQFSSSSTITIRDFTLMGNNPDGGTSASYHGSCESAMGVAIYGTSHVDIENVTIVNVYGDCVYIELGPGSTWSDDITINNMTCQKNGRSGVAVLGGSHVTVSNSHLDTISMYPLNVEPNSSAGGGTYITFQNNIIGTFGWAASYEGHLVDTNGGAAGAAIHDLTISGNTVTGGTLNARIQYSRTSNIVFTNNTSNVAGQGPVVAAFDNSDGVTVSGNVQPLQSGVFAWFRNDTGVSYQP
jgi:hypothetical protein